MANLHQLLQGKRFGLVLSAGFFGFYGHAGFLRGLFEAGLSPAAYAGTSAGGLVAAYAAGGASVEAIEELVLKQTRRTFWDPDPLGVLFDVARRGHAPTGLLKGERFRQLLEETLPRKRFEDLEKPLLLVAANITEGAAELFTKGDLAPRIHASCAYPGLFRAVKLDGRLFWDGGLVDKAPILPLADSEAGKGLDAILVHYLPSRTRQMLAGAFAYPRGMAAAMAAVRRDHFRLQLKVLEARGLPVYVVVSNLPPVSPTTMERGFDALAQARLSATRALQRPPRPFEVEQ
jgi:NTE family protein